MTACKIFAVLVLGVTTSTRLPAQDETPQPRLPAPPAVLAPTFSMLARELAAQLATSQQLRDEFAAETRHLVTPLDSDRWRRDFEAAKRQALPTEWLARPGPDALPRRSPVADFSALAGNQDAMAGPTALLASVETATLTVLATEALRTSGSTMFVTSPEGGVRIVDTRQAWQQLLDTALKADSGLLAQRGRWTAAQAQQWVLELQNAGRDLFKPEFWPLLQTQLPDPALRSRLIVSLARRQLDPVAVNADATLSNELVRKIRTAGASATQLLSGVATVLRARSEIGERQKALGDKLVSSGKQLEAGISSLGTALEQSRRSVAQDLVALRSAPKEAAAREESIRRNAEDVLRAQLEAASVVNGILNSPLDEVAGRLESLPVALPGGDSVQKILTAPREIDAALKNLSSANATSVLSAVRSISGTLGIDTRVGGTDILQVGLSIASGNFLGALAGIGGGGGIFGGGGTDSATQQQLARIQQQLVQIQESLDRIETKIDKLTDLVRQQHVEVMEALGNVSFTLDSLRSATLGASKTEAASCDAAEAPLLADRSQPDRLVFGRYSTVAAAVNGSDVSVANLRDCRVWVSRVALGNTIWPALSFSLAVSASQGRHYYEQKVTPYFTWLSQEYSDPKEAGYRLLDPQATYHSLIDYQAIPLQRLAAQDRDVPLRTGGLSDALQLIEPSALARYVAHLRFAAAAAPLVGADGRLYSLECLLGRVPCDFAQRAAAGLPELRRTLAGALGLVNTALAQQSLLDGDALLPFLAKQRDEASSKRDLETLLAGDDRFAGNYLAYLLYSFGAGSASGCSNPPPAAVRAEELLPVEYGFAYASGDPGFLQQLFCGLPGVEFFSLVRVPSAAPTAPDAVSNPLAFNPFLCQVPTSAPSAGPPLVAAFGLSRCEPIGSVCTSGTVPSRPGLYARLSSSLCVPLPPPFQVAHARFRHSADWQLVTTLREQLLDDLAELDASAAAPPRARQALFVATVRMAGGKSP